MKYTLICEMLAARKCLDSGMTVAEIACQARKSPTTIRRWITTTRGLA